MKLISCHIENFGKLRDYTVDFCEGTNIICEENGWGKSTLAAFIRVMFYGFEGEGKRNDIEKERRRFKPWQGGVYGGKLKFEVNEKEYVLTRIFGEKEAQDTFELRDANTNLISIDYTSNIGKELFQIDSNSFMRTAFIGQNEVETASTDDINAKIGNLADDTRDLNCYDNATDKLTKLMNNMNPKKTTGTIAKRTLEIASLERAVQVGSRIVEAMDQNQEYLQTESENLAKKEAERKETEKLQAKISKRQVLMGKKEEWERLVDAKEKRGNELAQIGEYFPNEMPKLDKVKEVHEQCATMNRIVERVSLYTLTEQETNELESLKSKFYQGVPMDSEIDDKLGETRRLTELIQESTLERLNWEESERLSELKVRFASNTKNVNTFIVNWNTRNTKKGTLPSNQAALVALQAAEDSKKKNKKVPVLALMGMIFVLISIVFVFAISEVIGVVGSVLGTILTILGYIFGKRQKKNQISEENPQVTSLRKTIEEDQIFIEQVDEEIKTYLSSQDKMFDEYMVSTILQELASEQAEYERLAKKEAKSQQSEKGADINNIKSNVQNFLGKYGIYVQESQFGEALHALKSDVKRHLLLSEKQKSFQEAKELYEKQKCEIVDFLQTYGWVAGENMMSQLKEIEEKVMAYKHSKTLYEESEKELQVFEEKTDISIFQGEILEEEVPSLDDVNEKLQVLAEEIDGIRKNIQEYVRKLEVLQEQYEEWEESKLKLEELKMIQEIESEKYRRIGKAKEYLTIAKESMTSRYARPLLESFSKYFEMITEKTTEHYHIDANATITVEEYGVQRVIQTLSSGYQDLVGLCLRIAMVDAMYQEETPMLIMDDPFVNLDDDKVKAAKEFLQEISKKYQVIYFTCSNARK